MAETVAERRAKLERAISVLQELNRLNEQAATLETTLVAQGISSAEIVITLNKLFDGAGPPTISAAAVGECDGDTVSDRLFNILNEDITGGIDWGAEASA